MDVDASLLRLGGFGLLQTLNYIPYLMCTFVSSYLVTAVSFTISEPDGHRCKLPPNGTTNETDGTCISKECSLVYYDGDGGENYSTPCTYGLEYESIQGETSYVTDLNLVCDKAILAGTLTSIHFGGGLAGSYILGQCSDNFGRRPVVLGSIIAAAATGTALSFTWNFGLTAVLRFMNGFTIPGILVVGYIRQIEMFTPNRRLRCQVFLEMNWVCGLCFLATMAYVLPNWRHLQLVLSLFLVPMIPFVWISYESIRWLVQKGKIEEAEKLLQKIAKSKNIPHSGYFLLPQRDIDGQHGVKPTEADAIELEPKSAPDNALSSDALSSDGFDPERKSLDDGDSPGETNRAEQGKKSRRGKGTLLDLFKTPALALRTLCIFYCWFVQFLWPSSGGLFLTRGFASSLVYYGFFINASNLVGNKYLNFALLAVTEAPSYVLNFFVMGRFGRRRPLMFYYFVSGVACVVTGFIPAKTTGGTDLTVVIMVMALTGKFFAASAFDIIYLVTAEIFPTVLRNAAIGAASVVTRAGGMVAPFIIFLGHTHAAIPLVAFGVVSLLAGFLVIPLPETHRRSLPETLNDGANLLAAKKPPNGEAHPTDV